MNNKFNFYIPIDIVKSKDKDSKDKESKYDNMMFKGVASDNSEDTEGESLEPSGYDLSYLLKYGFFDYNHMAKRTGDPNFFIGEPTDAKISGNQLLVKGKLWKTSEMARKVWDTMLTLKDSSSDRKIGMSIEGKALERDKVNPKKVTKALITNIAITMNPVNTNSWVDIVKGQQKEDYIEYEEEKSCDKEKGKDGDKDVLKEFEIDGKTFQLLKDMTLIEKMMDVASVSALKKESQDKKVRDVVSLTKSLNIIKKAIDDGLLTDSREFIEKNIKNLCF